MDNLLPENEFVEIEGRQYLNPQTGLDESNAFIENLRATQGQQNQQIAQDTYNLGTDIQSVQGGLGTNTPANMGYFTSRLQTPQTNSAVANLRAVAQAQALNEVLANEQAIWKKRYNDAYKKYQKRQNARSRGGGGGGGYSLGGNPGTTDGGVEYTYTDSGDREVGSVEPSYSPMGSGDYQFTSNASQLNGGGVLPINTGVIPGPTNNLLPNGNVNIQRDKFGRITSLTYNGKTFTGDAAQQRYNFLQNSGTIGGRN